MSPSTTEDSAIMEDSATSHHRRRPSISSQTSAHFKQMQGRLSKRDPMANLHITRHHLLSSLGFVVQSTMIALLVMVGIQLLAIVIWPKCTPGVPCKDKTSQMETFMGIIHERVPPLKKHSDGLFADNTHPKPGSTFDLLRSEAFTDAPPRDCVTPWIDVLRQQVGNTSQPALIQELMGYLRLSNNSAGREAIGSLWWQPQDFSATLDEVENCTRANAPVNAALCLLLDNPDYVPVLTRPHMMRSALTNAVHLGLVMEALNRQFMVSKEFRIHMATHFARISDEVEAAIVQRSRDLGDPESLLNFRLEKWESMLTPMLVSQPAASSCTHLSHQARPMRARA